MSEQRADPDDTRHFDVELLVVHPSADPANISRTLGLEAQFSHRVGEPRTTPKGIVLSGVHRDTRWRHSTRHSVTEQWFASILADFVERLGPHRDYLAGLKATGGSATVIIQFLGDGYLADSIPPEILGKLGDLGIALGIECFAETQA